MSLLKELSAQALIGSERRAPQLPQTSGALADLLQTLNTDSSAMETQILRTAGAISIYTNAGYLPAKTSLQVPASCKDEQYIQIENESLINTLQLIINDGPRILLRDALQSIRKRQLLIPAKLIPALLTVGKNSPDIVTDIISTVGVRGAWLAKFNIDWDYITNHSDSLDKDLWENGQLEQRLIFIKHLRNINADEARKLIANTIGELDARDRASLLETLHDNLNISDEVFIESKLADRSKEVRLTAATLLSKLPASQFVQRMQSRITTCLKQERKLLRKHWMLNAPDIFIADWAADAIEEKRAQSEPLGEKAWWLFQIARAIPLDWWQNTTELSPPELIDWALASDWSLALLRAWHQALLREKNMLWAEAFLKKMPFKEFQIDGLELMEFLSQQVRETYWIALLKSDTAAGRRGEFITRIVQQQSNQLLSENFSSIVLQNVKQHLLDDASKWDYTLRQSLVDFVCLIPHACFNDAVQGWPVDNPKAQFFTETISRLLTVVEQRKTLFQFLTSESS